MRSTLALATAAILSIATMPSHAGCMRCAPILNIADAPVTSASGKALSSDDVKRAIVRAGAALGWQMKVDGPGRISATLAVRKHTAAIAIPYSARSYSITYKSSTNLDEADGEIHRNYNSWIQNLSKGINAQLAVADM
jgi:hypothetical protein